MWSHADMTTGRLTECSVRRSVRPRAVLWDADGVLQHTPPGWRERLVELGGAGFPGAVLEAEAAPLAGDGSFRDAVASVVAERGLDVDPEEVLDLWRRLEVDPEALALVDELRAGGTPCYLTSNQQDLRVGIMRDELGYADQFDREFYSSELGVMKPSPAYFETVLQALALPAAEVLFIDDNAANVASATSVGLIAERHDPSAGVAGLREILSRHGLGH